MSLSTVTTVLPAAEDQSAKAIEQGFVIKNKFWQGTLFALVFTLVQSHWESDRTNPTAPAQRSLVVQTAEFAPRYVPLYSFPSNANTDAPAQVALRRPRGQDQEPRPRALRLLKVQLRDAVADPKPAISSR